MRGNNIYIGILFSLVVLIGQLAYAANMKTADKKSLQKMEQQLKKSPGNMDLRNAYITELLAAGDTTRAEDCIEYGLKLGEDANLYLRRAEIAWHRGNITKAAIYCVSAINLGIMPADEPMISTLDSLSSGGVTARLDKEQKASKTSSNALIALGQLCLEKGDTIGATSYYREAVRRGQTELEVVLDSLLKEDVEVEDTLIARIPYTRISGRIEVSCKLNGLSIKAEIDTSATESSISSVETSFILKNDYVSSNEIVDNSILVVRELDLGQGIILRGIRLHHKRSQEGPIIISPKDMKPIGNIVINEKEKVIEVRKAKEKSSTTEI